MTDTTTDIMRGINALEEQIARADDDARACVDALLWDQARQVVDLLRTQTQRAVAAAWMNARTNEPYNQKHVSYTARAFEQFTAQPRPRFRDAYNAIANGRVPVTACAPVLVPSGRPYEPSAKRYADIRALAAEGHNVLQIAERLGVTEGHCRNLIAADKIEVRATKVMGRTRRLNPNRIVDQMVASAELLTADVNLIDFANLDPAARDAWLRSLRKSARALSAFIRRLEQEMTTHDHHDQTDAEDAAGTYIEGPPRSDRGDAPAADRLSATAV